MIDKKRVAVIKVGGDVILDNRQLKGLVENIRTLQKSHSVVVLHGGGPQTSDLQQRLGMTPNKVGGRRITSKEDLFVIMQAIAGEVNVKLTSALIGAGLNAFGCHGASGRLIGATKRPPRAYPGTQGKAIDFGEVGDVTTINALLIKQFLDFNLIPVVATLGIDEQGHVFNINADTTVVAMAQQLQADQLFLCTQIGGVYKDLNDPTSLISHLTPYKAKALIDEGIIVDGMVPKIEEAIGLLAKGVGSIAIVSPLQPNAFQAVLNGTHSIGTVITSV